MLPPWLKRCTKEVSDDTPRSPTDAILARISSQPARDERANVRHVLLRLPTARVFCGKSPQNNPSQITVEQLDAALVLAFLEHLEKERNNCARTRNSRLAAIKTFF